jgi:hypothetical protein
MTAVVTQALLDLHPYVRVILASAPLASANETEEFAAWLRTVPDSHIKEWSSQPGNYQLMTKQGEAVMAAAARTGTAALSTGSCAVQHQDARSSCSSKTPRAQRRCTP